MHASCMCIAHIAGTFMIERCCGCMSIKFLCVRMHSSFSVGVYPDICVKYVSASYTVSVNIIMCECVCMCRWMLIPLEAAV